MTRTAKNKIPSVFVFGLLFPFLLGSPDANAGDDVVIRVDATNVTISMSDFLSAFGSATTPGVSDAAVEDMVLPIPALDITIDSQGGISAGTSRAKRMAFLPKRKKRGDDTENP